MRVCITNKYKTFNDSKTGKGVFALRLIKALVDRGVEVTTDPSVPVDVHMEFSVFHHKGNAKKRILRCGPVGLGGDKDSKARNGLKRDAIKHADAVVYQSDFSQNCYGEFIYSGHKKSVVVHNGAEVKIDPLRYETGGPTIFLAAAREWTPQKRLSQIVKAFESARLWEDSQLWIAGMQSLVPKKRFLSDGRLILSLGYVDNEELQTMINAADYLIHTTWLDACPNVVVEAICRGLPVIYTDQGGTKELMTADVPGCSIQDADFIFKPVDIENPPPFFMDDMVNSMENCMGEKIAPFKIPDHIQIQNVAEKYHRFFEEVLG